jgi:P27 family predicted phage terminase small subunit
MAGRRPKPTALKELQGNPGKRPINRREPKPKGIPTCPPHLDTVAKVEWNRILPELIAIGLITSIDRAALAAYCSSYSEWTSAETQIQKYGRVIKSPKSGFPIPNPYVGISHVALGNMHRFLTEFGMTPASRSHIEVDPVDPTDAFETFMRGIGTGDGLTDTNDPEPVSQSGE